MVKLENVLHKACHDYPDLQRMISIIPFIPLQHRKAIMTLCRTQQSPWSNTRIFNSIKSSLSFRFYATIHSQQQELTFTDDVLPIISNYLYQPVFLGFISMCIRCIPLEDPSSAYSSWTEGIDKEFNAVTGEDRPQIFDWSTIFGKIDDVEKPLHPMLPPRPGLSLSLRYRLSAWKVITSV
jgi:hypothetical protein